MLSKGKAALRVVFKSLAASVTSKWAAITGAYGKLYCGLTDCLKDDGSELFRDILRDCMLETWPLSAGKVVLGKALPMRLLHTPGSAATEIRVDKKVMETCLIAAGAVPENDPRPPALQTFTAPRYDSFLKEIPFLAGAPEI